MKKRPLTIPTLIGITILLVGLGVGIWLVQRGQIFVLRAIPEITPKQVKITNISDRSFSVSWTTDGETSGFVKYGSGGELSFTASDDRDQLSGRVGNFRIHHITITDLTPSTSYSFQIGSGQRIFDNNGESYRVTTGPTITAITPPNDVAYGNIVTAEGLPAEGALVYLSLANAATQSTLTKSSGNWAIPLNLVRSESLSQYLAYDREASIEEIFVQGGAEGTATAVTTTANDSPVPTIILGRNHDFRQGGQLPGTPTPTEEVTSQFPVQETPSSVTPTELTITNPDEGEEVNTQKPEFAGTAPAGTILQVRVESPEAQSGSVTVSSDGSWRWTPPENLEPGEHTLTISYTDENGQEQSLSRTFLILSPGSVDFPALTASPSATPTPTTSPTITPTVSPALTPTPTASPSGRVSLPSTEAAVPTPGLLTPTFLVFIMGLSLVFLGLSVGFVSKKQV